MVRRRGNPPGTKCLAPFGSSPRAVVEHLEVIVTSASAARGVLLKPHGGAFTAVATVCVASHNPRSPDAALASAPSPAILRRVWRTRRTVRAQRAVAPNDRIREDGGRPHGRALYLPVMRAGKVTAIVYVERSPSDDPFTNEQCRLATLLAPQIATTMQLIDDHLHEMAELQERVNPPFLHNALSVIAQLTSADSPKAEEAILMLSRLYRYVLSSSPERIVTLAQEVAMSRDYLALEKHRLGSRMQAEIEVQGPLERVHVPSRLLHTMIESSVSHGLATKLGGGRVRVAIVVSAEECRLRVEDDGLAWAERSPRAEPCLQLLKRRLALHYRRRHSFRIHKENGLAVEIRLSLGEPRTTRRDRSRDAES